MLTSFVKIYHMARFEGMSDSSLFFSAELDGHLQGFLEEKIHRPVDFIVFTAKKISPDVGDIDHPLHAITFSDDTSLVELSVSLSEAFDIASVSRDLELENLRIMYCGKVTEINGNFSVVSARIEPVDATQQRCILQLLLKKKSGSVI